MQPGSYYLEIQLTEYLLITLEFVTYYKTGTCHLEVKFIDYLLTSLEFITHYNLRIIWQLSDKLLTVFTMVTSEPFLVTLVCKEFSKSGQFGVPSPKELQCLLLPKRKGTYRLGYNRHKWLGNK